MLLPLWEGFDEPFHFGYAQALASGVGFPDPRHSRLSEEIARSIELAPASVPVKRNLPDVTTYSDFFALPASERQSRHQQLFQLDPKLRSRPSQYLNYEGQQAPLAYVILALPEWALARMPLPYRILALRIFCGSVGALLLFVNAVRLAARLNLSSPYSETLVFCAFSSQMTWATIAHVGNDWLAVPLALWLLVSVIDYHRWATVRHLVACALINTLSRATHKGVFHCVRPPAGRELYCAAENRAPWDRTTNSGDCGRTLVLQKSRALPRHYRHAGVARGSQSSSSTGRNPNGQDRTRS